TLQYLRERKYHRALHKVQRLVILRLFELSKLNVAKTGYKMRTHISKSLQVRCKTLKRAVDEHNKAAACLTPPKPPIDWSKISTYEFLEQVVLLRDTHNNLQSKRWSNPGIRETLKLVERVERAKEELLRLNNEVRSLHTAIRDDDMLYATTITSLPVSDPLRGAVSDFASHRRLIDRQILVRIHQIYSLPGFTG
ncbi:hypothetical protein PHLGIDRAFT_40382, partial [Phlebiopsis gigantea 11061_1 CR5-6]